MSRRHWNRIARGLFVTASTLLFSCSAASAGGGGGGPQSCETGNPCLVGTCLEDGSCETAPGNDGADCDTFNVCTTGTCSNGECQESPANTGEPCESSDLCADKNGTCQEGECVSAAFENGAPCREDLLGPCLTGTCTEFGSVLVCLPAPKCKEGPNNACEFNCNFFTGECESTPTHICDTACTTANCTPGEDFNYECHDRVSRADDTPCSDGSTCNGSEDTCQDGVCTGGGSVVPVCGNGSVEGTEKCDDGDTERSDGDACDENCELVPCGKPTNSSGQLPKASDALFALKAAVNSATCDLAVCDVNASGSITASDALTILKIAVGGDGELDCPAA